MTVELKIDKAVYLVDRASKTYYFLKRNPEWNKLTLKQNEENKKSINGYLRILRNKKTKKFVHTV